ncbi:hypothetical protein QR680_003292 [Steinernema hermaphroditum]|uniref:Folliculin-interacting protein middle domain-containing protein n=1 Tax=Steinernema hermaphroditum TaxID=289476 RepID=A0AA39LJX4_9BILA|nr:hypothetical protein QR680_003292 [Steinernema hermaphroditum]
MTRKGSIWEEGLQHSYSRSRLSSCCSNVTDSDNVKQIGIAVVLPEELRDFACTHIPVIQEEILKLEALYEGWNTSCDFFCLMYNAPRIAVPVWQGMSSSTAQDTTVRKFCSTLAELVATSDTKSSKYFVSITQSCVLMNHVSWVASVNSPTTCSNANDLLIGKNLPDKDLKPPHNCPLVFGVDVAIVCGLTMVLSIMDSVPYVFCDNVLALLDLRRCDYAEIAKHLSEPWGSLAAKYSRNFTGVIISPPCAFLSAAQKSLQLFPNWKASEDVEDILATFINEREELSGRLIQAYHQQSPLKSHNNNARDRDANIAMKWLLVFGLCALAFGSPAYPSDQERSSTLFAYRTQVATGIPFASDLHSIIQFSAKVTVSSTGSKCIIFTFH